MRDIFTQLRVRTGHDFSNYKRATMLRRIVRRISVHELADLRAYANLMRAQPEEAQALLRDLLIGVTNFFRDPEAFEALKVNIIPKLFAGKKSGDSVRVWVAGCATGEEAYSLAMLLCEYSANLIDAPKVQVFATDIDEQAIAFAREGFYTPNDAADVSPEQLRQFFIKEQDGYRVRRELRELVLFANQNLIKDPPFSHLDLVTCRNLLIYLNRTAQDRAFEVFHFALNPGGFLFLGNSESTNGTNDSFLSIDKEHRIFQSRAVLARTMLPVAEVSLTTMRADLRPKKEDRAQESRVLERLSYADIHRRLLEQYAAPSIVVNEKNEVVHLTERAARYMQLSGGEPSLNLLNIVRPELRLELRTALYQAAQDSTNIETRELQVRIDDRLQIVKLKVRPVLRADDATRGLLLVLFEETGEATETEQGQLEEITRVVSAEPITRQLEDELVRVKAHLRSTVEQYEVQTEELKASNEELQAMNEELRSAAEELETSKEELQSINEELLTVNEELKVKIEELSQSNNDFQNLMNSTEIGTVFLDRALRVKLFTPHARHIINLLPSDVGRPLADITNQFIDDDILKDIEGVLERLQTIEREIETGDERWFLMRALPYRTTEDQISGVVLTFLDITARHRQEEASRTLARNLEQQTRIFNATLTSISDFVYIFDRDGRFRFANQPLLDLLGITLEEIVGENFFDLNYPPDLAARLQKQIQQVYDMKEVLRDETPFQTRMGADGFYEYIFTPVFAAADSNTVDFVAGSTRDVSHRKQIELALRESQDRLHLTMESVTDYAILTMDTEGRFSSWNVGAERIFGYTEEEILGQHSAIIFTPEDRAAGAHEAEIRTAREEGRAADERWHLRRNGTRFYMSGVLTALYDGDNLTGYAKIARDLTEQQRAEEALRRAHEDLEHKVEERTHDLAKANELLRIENAERRRIEKARIQLLRQLVRVQDDERRRIARDIHDHLGQQSTALRLKLEALKEHCKKYAELCEPISQAQEIAAQLDGDVDFLAWELRPAALDDLGLAAALANFVREWSKHFRIPADFHSTGMETDRPSPEIEVNLYRIAQEALNNTCKHAQASRVDVLLERRDHHIVLIVEDDGIGFDDEHHKTGTDRGMGLLGMRERAALIGGTLEIEASPNQGTTIYARLPVSLPEEGDMTA